MERYSRHLLLKEVGLVGQQKIEASKVLVIGAGGLGCPALQYLAGAGVGSLGIIDFDVVEESNLQRQTLFGTPSIGKNKALVAKEFLRNLNPTINLNAYPETLSEHNVIHLFKEYDLIIDGTDNFHTRYLINDASILTGKPFIYGAIYKFEGQVSVFNYHGGPSYRCLFPKPPKQGDVPNCSEIGVLGVLPGIIGTMQASEALKIILGIGSPLSGRLYCYNALDNTSNCIAIFRNDYKIKEILQKGIATKNQSFSLCKKEDKISIEDIWKDNNTQIIDLRESNEHPKIKHSRVINIPLSQLEKKIKKLSVEGKKIFFCKSGYRSKKALAIMEGYNIKNCWLLKENADELWNHMLNPLYNTQNLCTQK